MHSKALDATIQMGVLDAMRRRQSQLTVETLLFALLDNAAARALLLACWVDTDILRAELESILQEPAPAAPGFLRSLFDIKTNLIRPVQTLVNGVKRSTPSPGIEYSNVLEKAQLIASRIGNENVSGAEVLLAICDAEESAMAKLLQKFGATRFAVSEYVLHGPWNPDSPPPVQAGFSHVMLLNDPLTPMEFVVDVLEKVFEFPRPQSLKLMLRIHQHGRGTCGVFPLKTANEKKDLVLAAAKAKGYSLQARCE